MDLKVGESDLKKLLDVAIIQALGDTGREALVKEVVRYLSTPGEKSGFGREPPSPLMRALQETAESAGRRYFLDKIQNDPAFGAALEQVYAEALRSFVDGPLKEKIVKAMGEAFERVFRDY